MGWLIKALRDAMRRALLWRLLSTLGEGVIVGGSVLMGAGVSVMWGAAFVTDNNPAVRDVVRKLINDGEPTVLVGALVALAGLLIIGGAQVRLEALHRREQREAGPASDSLRSIKDDLAALQRRVEEQTRLIDKLVRHQQSRRCWFR
jgi:hypothetical protein